ncbi:MAG: nickel transporter [Gammaproteobacteria bacterium]|nr:nickel transporter [Gammaproteobacteria bacterium]MCP5202442.1 nickel transporter [Gammaproteobacteria bacterium]
MRIIPVIDLKDGQAVHARQGRRDSYAPLVTRFADDAEPLAVARGMAAALPITHIYLADLDAIMFDRPNLATVRALARALPRLRLLVDAGFGPQRDCAAWLELATVDIVVASEALTTLAEYDALVARIPAPRLVLSLDRNAAGPLGCAELFEASARWPARVIHMNLARVGADGGPDLAGLDALRARAGAREVFAAGGVRGSDDLTVLAEHGIAAALVGTALHDGRLDATALGALCCAAPD